MKTITYFRVSALLISSLALLQNCTKKEVTPDRDKFIGIYKGNDSCSPGVQLTLSISASSTSENEVIMAAGSNSWKGTVSGNSITINGQPVVFNISATLNGTANLNGTSLNFAYTAVGGGQSISCTASLIKQ
jgi:hypothetical protein